MEKRQTPAHNIFQTTSSPGESRITWTDPPAQSIVGVQGRYFIAPVVLIASVPGGQTMSETRAKARVILRGGFLAISALVTSSTVLWRYYLGM